MGVWQRLKARLRYIWSGDPDWHYKGGDAERYLGRNLILWYGGLIIVLVGLLLLKRWLES